MAEQIDIEDYRRSVSSRMGPLTGMFDMVFKKQVKDLGIGSMASPKQVDELSEKVPSAMEFFAGPKMKVTIKRLMRSELRKRAPQYFSRKYGL